MPAPIENCSHKHWWPHYGYTFSEKTCQGRITYSTFGKVTLQKSNELIPRIAIFKGSYLFQTIILGPSMLVFGGSQEGFQHLHLHQKCNRRNPKKAEPPNATTKKQTQTSFSMNHHHHHHHQQKQHLKTCPLPPIKSCNLPPIPDVFITTSESGDLLTASRAVSIAVNKAKAKAQWPPTSQALMAAL